MAQASISTHVLDTGTGRPASGIHVRLYRGETLVAHADTGPDGRVAELGRDLEPGLYRLVFALPGSFFTSAAFGIRLHDGHHHVPLLLAPYGCVTYRGS